MASPKLYPYQLEAIQFAVKRKRVIIGHEMGLGKTAIALKVITADEHGSWPGFGKILILCPKSAVYVWQTECEKWLDVQPTLIVGKPEERKKLWESTDFVLCTFDILKRDIKPANMHVPLRWDIIEVDEAHRIRNRKTQIFKALKKLKSAYLIFLTGTPVSKGPQDLWTMLYLIKPHIFSSYWKFVSTFCVIDETPWGQEIIGAKNTDNLREILRDYAIRKTKRQVLPELPEKTRQTIIIDPSPLQRKLHDTLIEDMLVELNDTLLTSSTILTNIIKLRQILVTPQILDPGVEKGAGLDLILEHLADRDVNDRHMVIFTPFVRALPHIVKALNAEGHHLVGTLKGGVNPEKVKDTIEQFKNLRGIIVCTIKFAQSFSLESCSTGYFLGCEWDRSGNIQAEDRLHRMTTKNPVNIYYIRHKNTIEDRVFEILNMRNRTVNAVLKDPKELIKLLSNKAES